MNACLQRSKDAVTPLRDDDKCRTQNGPTPCTARRGRRVTKKTEIPDWETLLAHAALLQAKIPAAILVGARRRPCTPAIAFPLTMITSSKTWQRTTTRPFARWNPLPAGTHNVA